MKSRLSIFALTVWLSFPINMHGQTVLDVPETIQERDQWCWAAVSTAIIRGKGTFVSQCTVAEYTRIHATWHNFGSVDCCVDPLQGCNYWNYNWGFAGSIQDILQNWGISNYGYGASLALSMVQSNINENKPFIIRWGWTGGGGHFLVGYGVADSTLYYMNPWPGEGRKIADYTWVVTGSNHTWTHTNILTTALPIQLASFTASITNQQQVRLNWTTVSETNNYGFEIQKSDSTQEHYRSIPNVFIPGYGTTNEPHHYTFVDSAAQSDHPYYRLKQIDIDGAIHYSDGVRVNGLTHVKNQEISTVFSLLQNYPNPFNPTTTIMFSVGTYGHASLRVYDVLGREVATLVDEVRDAGAYEAVFDASGFASGVYFYKLESGSFVQTKKMLILQ